MWVQILLSLPHIEGSVNGRLTALETVNEGSIPSPSTTWESDRLGKGAGLKNQTCWFNSNLSHQTAKFRKKKEKKKLWQKSKKY